MSINQIQSIFLCLLLSYYFSFESSPSLCLFLIFYRPTCNLLMHTHLRIPVTLYSLMHTCHPLLTHAHTSHEPALVAAQNGVRLLLHEFHLNEHADAASLLIAHAALEACGGDDDFDDDGDDDDGHEDRHDEDNNHNHDDDGSGDVQRERAINRAALRRVAAAVKDSSIDRWTVFGIAYHNLAVEYEFLKCGQTQCFVEIFFTFD